jgi:hypothetical protein
MRGNRGQLEVPLGNVFHLAFGRYWKPKGSWTEHEQSLIRFATRGFWKQTTWVDIEPTARQLGDLPLLVLLGYFCIRVRTKQMAQAATPDL